VPQEASFIAVLNSSGAVLAYSKGDNYLQPADAVLVEPYIYIGLPMVSAQKLTVHWTSAGALSLTNNQAVLLFSNAPLPVSGGPMTTGGVASNVTLVGTPTVNINTMPNVAVTSMPNMNVLDGGIVTLGLEADAAVTNPATAATLIALTKGQIKQMQGGGTGALPVSAANLDATISSLVTAVNSATTAVNKQNASTPTVYNLTCTAANTEYSQALPANTKRFAVMNQGNNAVTTWKMYFASAAAATMNFPGNVGYTEEMIYLAAQTLYFKSSNAGDVIQILAWT